MLQALEACWMRARDRAAAARGGEGGRVGAMVVLAVGLAVATAGRREWRTESDDGGGGNGGGGGSNGTAACNKGGGGGDGGDGGEGAGSGGDNGEAMAEG